MLCKKFRPGNQERKTKILTHTRNNRRSQNITTHDNIETAEHMTYVGTELCEDGLEDIETKGKPMRT